MSRSVTSADCSVVRVTQDDGEADQIVQRHLRGRPARFSLGHHRGSVHWSGSFEDELLCLASDCAFKMSLSDLLNRRADSM